MVYELKEPVDGSKGVLIFTQKERHILESDVSTIKERIRLLQGRYVIGMHWGWYHQNVPPIENVDFHLAGEGTVSFSDDDTRHIPLCSRNFIPSYFDPLDVPKQWDILCIATPVEAKRLTDFLEVARMVLDEGVQINILLWCKVTDRPKNLSPGKWDRDLFRMYEERFSDHEKESIQLATPLRSPYPVPHKVLPYLYNASKAFTLFTQTEGESRVIHEALLCGTPVIVRSDLRGGGRDYLNNENSWSFGSLKEAKEIFIQISENQARTFDTSKIKNELSEPITAERLEEEIRTVFREMDEEYQGSIEKCGLSNKLPSHTLSLPPEWRLDQTDDLSSRTSFIQYADWLLGRSTDRRDVLRTKLESLPFVLDAAPRTIENRLGSYLRRVDHRLGTSTLEIARRIRRQR